LAINTLCSSHFIFDLFFSFFRRISPIYKKKANERCVTPVTLVSGCSVFFFLFFLMNFCLSPKW
jgi:hypothetical protein